MVPAAWGKKHPNTTQAIEQSLQLTTVDVTLANCCNSNNPPQPKQNLGAKAKL
jgi:hypothetical protein